MSQKRKFGRCPNCCPDTKDALYHLDHDFDSTAQVWTAYWVCENCLYRVPKRAIKPPADRLTPSQRRTIKGLRRAFGGTVSWKRLTSRSRNVFVEMRNPARRWFSSQVAYGTVGPTGHFKISLPRFGGETRVIRNWISVGVWMRDDNPQARQHEGSLR